MMPHVSDTEGGADDVVTDVSDIDISSPSDSDSSDTGSSAGASGDRVEPEDSIAEKDSSSESDPMTDMGSTSTPDTSGAGPDTDVGEPASPPGSTGGSTAPDTDVGEPSAPPGTDTGPDTDVGEPAAPPGGSTDTGGDGGGGGGGGGTPTPTDVVEEEGTGGQTDPGLPPDTNQRVPETPEGEEPTKAQREAIAREVRRDPDVAGFDPEADITSAGSPGAFRAEFTTDAGQKETRFFTTGPEASEQLRRSQALEGERDISSFGEQQAADRGPTTDAEGSLATRPTERRDTGPTTDAESSLAVQPTRTRREPGPTADAESSLRVTPTARPDRGPEIDAERDAITTIRARRQTPGAFRADTPGSGLDIIPRQPREVRDIAPSVPGEQRLTGGAPAIITGQGSPNIPIVVGPTSIAAASSGIGGKLAEAAVGSGVYEGLRRAGQSIPGAEGRARRREQFYNALGEGVDTVERTSGVDIPTSVEAAGVGAVTGGTRGLSAGGGLSTALTFGAGFGAAAAADEADIDLTAVTGEIGTPQERRPVAPTELPTPSGRQPVVPTDIAVPRGRQPVAPSEFGTPQSRQPVAPSEFQTPSGREPVAPSELPVPSDTEVSTFALQTGQQVTQEERDRSGVTAIQEELDRMDERIQRERREAREPLRERRGERRQRIEERREQQFEETPSSEDIEFTSPEESILFPDESTLLPREFPTGEQSVAGRETLSDQVVSARRERIEARELPRQETITEPSVGPRVDILGGALTDERQRPGVAELPDVTAETGVASDVRQTPLAAQTTGQRLRSGQLTEPLLSMETLPNIGRQLVTARPFDTSEAPQLGNPFDFGEPTEPGNPLVPGMGPTSTPPELPGDIPEAGGGDDDETILFGGEGARFVEELADPLTGGFDSPNVSLRGFL